MRRSIALLLTLSVIAAASMAQIPQVEIDDRSVSLQASLFPDLYKSRSAAADMRWVRANDSELVAFWTESGPDILETLAIYSGIPWFEGDFDIHVIRFYTAAGSSKPLIIPLAGIRKGILTEAIPGGASMKLNLIYQLAHRNLSQAERLSELQQLHIANHPLMQHGAYRRDNLAMLLTLVTSQEVMGLDSTYAAYQSAFWKKRTPGRQIMEDYLLSEWILSSERPLAVWIDEEPITSRLVTATRRPRRQRSTEQPGERPYVEGLPLKGQLGFSVRTGESGLLVVDKIDIFRLAYACGLREGDIIRRVDNSRPRTHKDLIEKVIEKLYEGGATLQLMRDRQIETIILQPLDLELDDDIDYWESFEDSLFIDESGEIPSPESNQNQ